MTKIYFLMSLLGGFTARAIFVFHWYFSTSRRKITIALISPINFVLRAKSKFTTALQFCFMERFGDKPAWGKKFPRLSPEQLAPMSRNFSFGTNVQVLGLNWDLKQRCNASQQWRLPLGALKIYLTTKSCTISWTWIPIANSRFNAHLIECLGFAQNTSFNSFSIVLKLLNSHRYKLQF